MKLIPARLCEPKADERTDQSNNPVIQGLTQQILPVLQKVLSPPEEQLSDETRQKVIQLAQYLQSQQ